MVATDVSAGLLETIRRGVLVADGAIGTELQQRGLEPGASCELWNLEHPEKVAAVHSAYIDAGAQLLTTNTFRANRIALAQFDAGSDVSEINRASALIAREAAAGRAFVMGSMGPLGAFIEPLGDVPVETAFDVFLEQANALVGAGVDAIIIETMSAIEEIEIAIRAARQVGAVVIASMTFEKARDEYRTMMGVTIRQAVEVMTLADADIVGCNCGTGLSMDDYVAIAGEIRSLSDKPIIIEPNAGQPEIIDGRIVYDRPANEMAAEVWRLMMAGANIIGGCCGTTPEHISLFREAVKGHSRVGTNPGLPSK